MASQNNLRGPLLPVEADTQKATEGGCCHKCPPLRASLALATVIATLLLCGISNFLAANTKRLILDYCTIPVCAAIVGFGTNAVAIYMTFYPLEFVGCCQHVKIGDQPIGGWQGIIPTNCERMARQAMDQMMEKMLDAEETFNKIEATRIAADLLPALQTLTPKILDTVASEFAPRVWRELPKAAKDELTRKLIEDAEESMMQMLAAGNGGSGMGKEQEGDLVDMLVAFLIKDKQLVNDIFLKTAEKEFDFIKYSGFYLGFLFGLGQMYVWSLRQEWWTLPIAGALVGYLTNFVALKMIFLPAKKRVWCGITIQGLFLQRQPEVAVVYSKMLSSRVLKAEYLIDGVLNGKNKDAVYKSLDENIQSGIDNVVPSQRLVRLVIGSDEFKAMKDRISEEICKSVPTLVTNVTAYLDEALDVEKTLKDSLNKMSTEDFKDMLYPAFQEGELKLVVMGGILGAGVGMLQALWQVPEQFGL